MKKIQCGIFTLSLCFFLKISAPSPLEDFLRKENPNDEYIQDKINIARLRFEGFSWGEMRSKFYQTMNKRIFKSIIKELEKSLLLEDDLFLRSRKKKTKKNEKF